MTGLGVRSSGVFGVPGKSRVCLTGLGASFRRVAAAADAERTRSGKGHPGEVLEKAAEGMMSCFRVCAGDT